MRHVVTTSLLLGAVATTSSAEAQVAWFADFETGDVSQWQGTLNGQYIQVVGAPVAEGSFAGEITLTNDAVWPGNNLRRVEFRHVPDASRTAEGAETYFAWSFYLPEPLPEQPSQQIGYWESDQSYQQMMAFTVEGERLRFVTRQPTNVTQWDDATAATAGQWHRIAMHLVWSKDENVGAVSLWFDGEQVVNAASARTLNDDNPHFTQVGLLRGDMDFADAPVIVIDDAIEGDSLADVKPDGQRGTGGAGGNGTGGSGATGGAAGVGGSGASGGSGGASTGSGSEGESGDDGGCGCHVVAGGTQQRWWLWLVAGAALLRRRRSGTR